MSKKAFDEALPLLDELDEEEYKSGICLMGLLRDNYTLWCNEN